MHSNSQHDTEDTPDIFDWQRVLFLLFYGHMAARDFVADQSTSQFDVSPTRRRSDDGALAWS